MSAEPKTPPGGELQQLEAIMEVIVGIASKDFSRRARLTGDGSILDGIAAGLNMLAEEVGLQQAREAELQRNLIRAERLAAVGQLAAGVAHEINNPAAFILSNLSIVSEYLTMFSDALERLRDATAGAEGAAVKDILDTIRPEALREVNDIVRENTAGMERIVGIVRQLKGFAHLGGDGVEVVDLNDVVLDACKLMRKQIDYRARLTQRLGELPRLHADRGRLVQVVTNLLANAVQALPEGAAERHEIEVTTGVEADWLVIGVRDTGPGIPPEVQGRLFEPFFTTKPREQGSGLGLSISAEIVAKHGGDITFTTEQGRGTHFRVRLPRHTGLAPVSRPPPPVAAPAPSRRLRLLLIDDEPMLLSSYRRTLGKRFEVTTALGGHEGLARIEQQADWDVILCDLMMPDLDGPAVYEQVRTRFPGVEKRFLFCSGGAFTARCRDFVESMAGRVLDKPLTVTELEPALSRLPLGEGIP